MGYSKGSKERLNKAQKKAKALDLRLAGYTYAKIAEALGISDSSAHRYVSEGLDEANRDALEGAHKLRKVMNGRLEKLITALWKDALTADSIEERRRSIRELVKLLDRQAKLLGLDAPRVIEATLEGLEASVSPEEAEGVMTRAIEKFLGGSSE